MTKPRFNICKVESHGYLFGHFLDDLVRLIQYGIEDNGYSCSIRMNKIEPGKINIVMGGHLLTSKEQVDLIAKQGPYIAFQGEILETFGINGEGNRDFCEQIYHPFLKRARVVWDGVQQNLTFLEQLGIRGHLLLGGYHPYMEEVRHCRNRDIDFLFFGSPAPRRLRMIEELEKRGFGVVCMFDDRACYRNDLISRTKVHISPGRGQGMTHLPWTRVCYLLNNRCVVAVETCDDQQWLEHCFQHAQLINSSRLSFH